MQIARKVRVDLAKFSPSWEKSFILVMTAKSPELIKYQKESFKIEKEQKKLDREIASLNEQIAIIPEESKRTELYTQLDDAEERRVAISEKQLSTIRKFVQDKFVDGMIFDEETKQNVPLKKEDLTEFDSEVLSECFQAIAGSLGKA